jgi:hypothetical protein
MMILITEFIDTPAAVSCASSGPYFQASDITSNYLRIIFGKGLKVVKIFDTYTLVLAVDIPKNSIRG